MKRLASFVALLCLTSLLHAEESTVIPASDKAALEEAKGKNVVVEGKIASAEWSQTGKVMNIEFEGAPHMTGAVFERNRAKLDAAFGGDLAKSLTGATVRLNGPLSEFRGNLQIIIKTGNQITILAPATQPAGE